MDDYQQQEQMAYNSQGRTNINYGYAEASALAIRLDTQKTIKSFEMWLRGGKLDLNVNPKTHQVESNIVYFGESKSNESGIQSLISLLSMILNPQSVQGNWDDEEQYYRYISRVQDSIDNALLINCYDWQVRDEDIELISDTMMNLIIPFATRQLDNKERESYAKTIHTNETNQPPQKSYFKLWR